MDRKSERKYKSCGTLEGLGAGRGEVWYDMVEKPSFEAI